VAGPEKKSATAQDAGRNCPYCRFALKEGADAMVCGACMAPHHLDCWTDNGGCAVMGCAGGPTGTGATPGTAEAASRTAVPGGSQTPPPQAPPPATAPPAPSGGSRGPQLSIAILVLAVAILGVAGAIVLTKGSSPRTPAAVISPGTTGATTGTSIRPTTGPTTGPTSGGATKRTTTVRVQHTAGPAQGAVTAWRHYWQLEDEGDYSAMFAMETADERDSFPDLVQDFESGQPSTIVDYAGPAQYQGGGVAYVPAAIFTHNRYSGADGDTSCREFAGTAVMVKSDGEWLYGKPSWTESYPPPSDCDGGG
jgi:hypothetical protein